MRDDIVLVHIAAKLMGCSPRTIRRKIQSGELPATRVNERAWGIPKLVLVLHIKERRTWS